MLTNLCLFYACEDIRIKKSVGAPGMAHYSKGLSVYFVAIARIVHLISSGHKFKKRQDGKYSYSVCPLTVCT